MTAMMTEHSFLFVPGHRPERFAKALASGSHGVILDLEDAVGEGDKAQARQHAGDWLKQGNQAWVRINGMDTPWFSDDLAMLRELPQVGVMLPKAQVKTVAHCTRLLGANRLIALVETVQGWFDLEQMCTDPRVERLAFGSVDFALDSGIQDTGGALDSVRTHIVLQSRRAGKAAPIDGVSTHLHDIELMAEAVRESRRLGFGAKLCIHPKQVEIVNREFAPNASQIEWAQRVMAAFEASQGGAVALDGQMIDKPVVDQAKRVLACI